MSKFIIHFECCTYNLIAFLRIDYHVTIEYSLYERERFV
jgi:hypothetical protein